MPSLKQKNMLSYCEKKSDTTRKISFGPDEVNNKGNAVSIHCVTMIETQGFAVILMPIISVNFSIDLKLLGCCQV